MLFIDTLSADNGSYQKLDYAEKWIQARSMMFLGKKVIISKYTVLVRFSCRTELERIWYLLKLIAWNAKIQYLYNLLKKLLWKMVEQEFRDYVPEKTVMVNFLRSLLNSNLRRESFMSGMLAPYNYGARGLGVMTPPWHGGDRRFNSCRAHQ